MVFVFTENRPVSKENLSCLEVGEIFLKTLVAINNIWTFQDRTPGEVSSQVQLLSPIPPTPDKAQEDRKKIKIISYDIIKTSTKTAIETNAIYSDNGHSKVIFQLNTTIFYFSQRFFVKKITIFWINCHRTEYINQIFFHCTAIRQPIFIRVQVLKYLNDLNKYPSLQIFSLSGKNEANF